MGKTRRERPVLIYDGDCGFCTASVRFAERHIRADTEIAAFQFADLGALGTTQSRAEREVLWIDRDGRVFGGAQAAARLLRHAGGAWWPLGALAGVPPLRWAAPGIYRLIAGNRHRLPGGTPACALPPDERPGAGPDRTSVPDG